MRKLQLISIFIIINIYSEITAMEDNFRNLPQSNVFEILRHVLQNSESGSPQDIYNPSTPIGFIAYPVYPHYPSHQKVVVNVNQAESKPTTVINNLNPESVNSCPCQSYLRNNGQLECLCQQRQIFRKCMDNSVCVLRHLCNNGVLYDTSNIQNYYSSQSNLCDELTHTCCSITSEVKSQNSFQEQHQIYTHLVNSSIDQLNNTVTKYIINGNVHFTNGNPITEVKVNNKEKFRFSAKTISKDNQTPSLPQTTVSPTFLSAEDLNKFKPNQHLTTTNLPILVQANKNPVLLSSENSNLGSTTESAENGATKIDSSTTESKKIFTDGDLDNRNDFINKITTYRPKLPPSISTTTLKPILDVLNPNELSNIFGSPIRNPNQQTIDKVPNGLNDVTLFPGLLSTTKNPVELSFVNKFSSMPNDDMPQSTLQLPNKVGSFFSGKVEKLRNLTRTNATTSGRGPISIGQRIINPNKIVNMITAQGSNNNESIDKFIMDDLMELTPPNNIPSQFSTPRTLPLHSPITKGCPFAMKCVQAMYCTSEGFVSTVPVILTKEEELRKNALMNCGDESIGQIGKCCFDKNS